MDNRATIYMNDEDKQKIDRLLQALDKRGVKDVRGPRGLSMSALFRYLVEKELSDLDPTFTQSSH